MNHKIRLGPIAVFLAVVAVVLSTLAVLTTATTNADKVLAERFASVTHTKYELESKGERFLQAYDEAFERGSQGLDVVLPTEPVEDGFRTRIEQDGYVLEIVVSAPDDNGDYEIRKWQITKIWNADTPMNNIWLG